MLLASVVVVVVAVTNVDLLLQTAAHQQRTPHAPDTPDERNSMSHSCPGRNFQSVPHTRKPKTEKTNNNSVEFSGTNIFELRGECVECDARTEKLFPPLVPVSHSASFCVSRSTQHGESMERISCGAKAVWKSFWQRALPSRLNIDDLMFSMFPEKRKEKRLQE